jgi:2,4-dienoyl-CoA reductase-like NADH-dependent reductase (Old Yellow Enzyme family)
MSTLTDQFLDEIETFLTQSGMDATAFGKSAMSDPSFVFDLRAGRSPSIRTVDRCRNYMRTTRAKPRQGAA